MQQPVLPHFPEEPLDQESLDRLSDELIRAYSSCRVTTPIRIHPLIKRTPVRLNFDQDGKQMIKEPQESIPEFAGDQHASVLSESTVTVTETTPVEPVPYEAQKCFLHPKPKSSCKRCQEYLSMKKVLTEPSPKKPRP